jgi:2-polyprenyl-6-methoxyphenol hydroxylase-like FAD-dependent oxidoreductase
MVPQNVTESLLVEELRRRGGNVEYGTAFVAVERQIDGMRVTVEHGGNTADITATFVVGCDGAHSKVRKAMNLTLEGGEYDASFLLADVETNDALPADELQLCPSELGPVAIFPISASRRRVVATIDQTEGDAPSLELVQRILKERAPEGIVAHELHWSSYFRIHHRHASRLRAGRMFIAGDAAHIHSPFGGQGMNTGLHDIWNLVWKLDLFLKGHGNEQLLDSYGAERIPIIKSVIETTDFLTKALGTPNKFAQAIRNVVIPMVSRLSPFQHAFVQRLSELGINYAGSPIVEGPGQRYLDDSMRGGEGIRSHFLLMTGEGDGTDSKELSALDEDIVEVRPSRDSGIKLVRPDGYVAYAARAGPPGGALRSVRALLERHTA